MQQVSSGVVDEPPHLIFKFARFRRQRSVLVVFHVVVFVVLFWRQLVRAMVVVIERGVCGHPVEPEFDHPESVRTPTVNAIYSETGCREKTLLSSITLHRARTAKVNNYFIIIIIIRIIFYPPLLLVAARSDRLSYIGRGTRLHRES